MGDEINRRRWQTLSEFFKDALGPRIRRWNNSDLFDKTVLAFDDEFKTKKLVVVYDGVKIFKREGRKWSPFKGRSKEDKAKIQEFNEELQKAKERYDISFKKIADDQTGVTLTEDTLDNVARNVMIELEAELERLKFEIEKLNEQLAPGKFNEQLRYQPIHWRNG